MLAFKAHIDKPLDEPPRRFADDTAARLSERLQPRGEVYSIANRRQGGIVPFNRSYDRHSAADSGAYHRALAIASLKIIPSLGKGSMDSKGGAAGVQRVILLRIWNAEDCHDAIAGIAAH
ncbi:MAG: hypothetical protein Q8J79_05535 [Erythrobacter sp.]|nr:hypothetical protein [Erythrobacter sp.]